MSENLTPFNEFETDALKELINIGVGRGAASLNQVLHQPIKLDVPNIKFCGGSELIDSFDRSEEIYSMVKMKFDGAHKGEANLIFHKTNSLGLIEATLGMSLEENDPLFEATQIEIGNILINAVLGSMGNILEEQFRYSPPSYSEGIISNLLQRIEKQTVLSISANFEIQSFSVEGRVCVIYDNSTIEVLKNSLNALIS